MRTNLEHYLNPLHIYCRLKDYHIPKARQIAEFYEPYYRRWRKVMKSKWNKRLPKSI